jgi:hypothetical protein
MSGTAPYDTQAFSPLPGRSFRLVAGGEGGGPTHCPEPPSGGPLPYPNGRRYRVEACQGHRPRVTTAPRLRASAERGRGTVPAAPRPIRPQDPLPSRYSEAQFRTVLLTALQRFAGPSTPPDGSPQGSPHPP